MAMNCGLAAWSVRLFAAFLLVQCIFVLVFGSAGWTAYMVPPEPDGDHSGAAAAAMHGSGSSADGHSMIDEASTRRILAEGSAPDAELQMAMVAARQEGAHAAMQLEHIYQFAFCAMCFVVNELSSGRTIQRVLLFILVVTYATATAGIAAWLVPAGYSEDKAQTEVLAVGAIEIAMFVMLCVDCCGGHEERLKSGHHKSRLSSRCHFAKWIVRAWCLLLMGQAVMILGFNRLSWDHYLGTPGVVTTVDSLKQRVKDLEALNFDLQEQLSTCHDSSPSSSISHGSGGAISHVSAPTSMPSMFKMVPSALPAIVPEILPVPAPTSMPVVAAPPPAPPKPIEVPDAKDDGKKGDKDKKNDDEKKSLDEKKSPDDKKTGSGDGRKVGGGGGLGGGGGGMGGMGGGTGSDGPDWDLLAELTGTMGAAGADKKDPPGKATLRKLSEEDADSTAAEAAPPAPPPQAPPATTTAAAASPPGPVATATGPTEVVECLAGEAACAVWGAKVEGAYVGMKLGYVFQTGMAVTAIAVNEVGPKTVQRAVLFFLLATLAAATACIYAWLVPIGFDESVAAAQTAQGFGAAACLFVLLCLDCYLAREGGCCDGQSGEMKELKKFHAIPKDEEAAIKSENKNSTPRSKN